MAKRQDFSKEKNVTMGAEDVRQFADDIAARSSRIIAILHESARLLDQAGNDAQIVPIASMFSKFLTMLETRAVKQFRAKAMAELEIQKSLRNEAEKKSK